MLRRLARRWSGARGVLFRDEVVLYIGLTGTQSRRPPRGEVSKRVEQYYKTRLVEQAVRTQAAGR